MVREIRLIGIEGIPEVKKGDDVARLMLSCAQQQGTPLSDDDILVVTQKIVSKSEGMVVNLSDISPTDFAERVGQQLDKDPRLVEVILQQSRRIVRMDKGVLLAETKLGYVCANAGVDASNIPGEDTVCLLPENPDVSAKNIRDTIHESTGAWVAVLISDTFGRPWREGTTNIAIGVAGINPLIDHKGVDDSFGRPLQFSVTALADELTGASDLVADKIANIPAVIIRGLTFDKDNDKSKFLIRDTQLDLFR